MLHYDLESVVAFHELEQLLLFNMLLMMMMMMNEASDANLYTLLCMRSLIHFVR